MCRSNKTENFDGKKTALQIKIVLFSISNIAREQQNTSTHSATKHALAHRVYNLFYSSFSDA